MNFGKGGGICFIDREEQVWGSQKYSIKYCNFMQSEQVLHIKYNGQT